MILKAPAIERKRPMSAPKDRIYSDIPGHTDARAGHQFTPGLIAQVFGNAANWSTFDSGSAGSEFAPDQAPTYALVADDYFCQPEVSHDSFENRGAREDYVGAPRLDTRQLLSLFERNPAQKRNHAQHFPMCKTMPVNDGRVVRFETERHSAKGCHGARDSHHHVGPKFPSEGLQRLVGRQAQISRLPHAWRIMMDQAFGEPDGADLEAYDIELAPWLATNQFGRTPADIDYQHLIGGIEVQTLFCGKIGEIGLVVARDNIQIDAGARFDLGDEFRAIPGVAKRGGCRGQYLLRTQRTCLAGELDDRVERTRGGFGVELARGVDAAAQPGDSREVGERLQAPIGRLFDHEHQDRVGPYVQRPYARQRTFRDITRLFGHKAAPSETVSALGNRSVGHSLDIATRRSHAPKAAGKNNEPLIHPKLQT